MANIEIYTWQFCPFCLKAKDLLNKKNLSYEEHSIDGDENARDSMTLRANGKRTVPQIFINNKSIGGCDDLYELERSKQLNKLLGIEES